MIAFKSLNPQLQPSRILARGVLASSFVLAQLKLIARIENRGEKKNVEMMIESRKMC